MRKSVVISVVALVVFLIAGGIYLANSDDIIPGDKTAQFSTATFSASTNINNKYFSLPVGRKLIFESQTPDGLERIEISIFGEPRLVNGVTTLIYRDKVYLDGELVEDTRDFLAQDDEGNVWYFGEEVDNYENGVIANHEGSWLAGLDGAEAGIWMKANPKVGDTYRQEYYKGFAEDMADVLSVNETITVRGNTYTDCLKIYDYTPLDPQSKEHKYYCPETASLVRINHLVEDVSAELVEIIEE